MLDLAELPLVKNISPEFMQEVPVVYGSKQASHMVRGVAASYATMRSETPLPGGRFLDDEDVRLRRRVAFIGSEVDRKLFAGLPAVGETIRVRLPERELSGRFEGLDDAGRLLVAQASGITTVTAGEVFGFGGR